MFLSSRSLQGNHDRDVLIVKKLIASGVVVIYMTQMWSLVRIERKGGLQSYPNIIKLYSWLYLKKQKIAKRNYCAKMKHFSKLSKDVFDVWRSLAAVKNYAFQICMNNFVN